MQKSILILLLPFILNSCDYIGSNKVKNLIDLTTKLEVETNREPKFVSAKEDPHSIKDLSSYKISSSPILSQPAIAKSIMYNIDNKGRVNAFSLKDKKLLWTQDISKNSSRHSFQGGGIHFSNGNLYITNGSRFLVVLNAQNGHEIIRKEFPDILPSKPVMATDRLLILQTISNQLLAYDIKDSKLVWMNEGGLEVISAKHQIHPFIYNGYVLASYSSGEVVYIDIKTGQTKWTYNLLTTGEAGLPGFEPTVIVTEPIVVSEYAYFATSNGFIIKMNLENGQAVWRREAADVQSMSLFEENIFVTNNARQLAIISIHDGKVSWAGNLISEKEEKVRRLPPIIFQKPYLTKNVDSKNNNSFAINVAASNRLLYQFTTDDAGRFTEQRPTLIRKIPNKVRYSWISCCSNKLHLITDTKVEF